jgi:peptidoglycan/xylan/chitin deacetylase (PgdA/CDA1 family)
LPGLARGDLRTELALSKETLEGLTGERARWFAYPYVAADDSTRAAVREAGYDGACGGYNRPAAQFDLPRIDTSVFTLPQLRLRTNPFFHVARQMGRSARARLRP